MFPHITRACQGVPRETVETAQHDPEKTETTTGLSAVVRVLDKIEEPGRTYAQHVKHTGTIVFVDDLPNGSTPPFPRPQEFRNLVRTRSSA